MPPTVLIVDDNPADVDLMKIAFEDTAADVAFAVAPGGGEALAHLRNVIAGTAPRPALALLDLNMPRVDGREVLTFIKQTPALASIVTVVLTSSSAADDRRQCLALGADDFLTKAHTLDDLGRLVARLIGMLPRGPGIDRFAALPPGDAMARVGAMIAAWSRGVRPAFAR